MTQERIRVLIVDDDVPTRVGLETILASEPDLVVVGQAADGVEACELAASLAPDVVLMDLRLPRLDGIQATRRITGAADDGPKVLVLTTFEIDDYVYRSMQAGASGFLLKRARAEEIVDAVRAVADGSSLPSASSTTRLIASFVRRSVHGASVVRPNLTSRESDVLTLIARGLSNHQIAEHLDISVETVRTHVKRVYMKCGARDRAQAVIVAYETGLVGLTPEGDDVGETR